MPKPSRRPRSISVRRVRLASGLVLFTYVTLHFANHALGNISIDAMEKGLGFQKLLWQSRPGAILLYGALLIHMGLGFWALYERRQFRWTRLEATQLALGLLIPFLLADHILGTRVALSAFGLNKGYNQELFKFWVGSPPAGALQTVLLLIVWIHGSIGIHFWLALKPFYPRVRNLLLSIAVLLPALALLGYFQGGRQTLQSAIDPAWQALYLTPAYVGTADENALLVRWRGGTLAVLAATLALTMLARGLRSWRERRVGSIRLTYPDRTIRVPRGLSVLEASLRNNIPHAHVCGGRGRCSTCRIRILGDPSLLPAISAAEQAVLDRIGAGANVRLACQLRPTRDIAFVPLLPPHAAIGDVHRGSPARSGDERYVVIMFVDMRGSSKLAEGRLPYDTVFIINQFLNAVSRAVIAAGGEPNQVLGDGLLALFGLKEPPAVACRQAVAACAAIAANVEGLNLALSHGLHDPIRFGIGIHAGLIVAGDIGHGRHAQFTVIGDPVNVAARLQDLTKPLGCEVLMSEEVYVHAGFAADDLPSNEVDARGREGKVKVRCVARAADLTSLSAQAAT
ncbi:MAG: adenylate/guanylate cyclase domain-containing protein [Hyphomicrobiales bacterium]|nr:adenylate/guanylate cyclase domain-containing protein [Hyphomicrobiales bacterium]